MRRAIIGLLLIFSALLAHAEDDFGGMSRDVVNEETQYENPGMLVHFADEIVPRHAFGKIQELYKQLPELSPSEAARKMDEYADEFALAYHSGRRADAFVIALTAHAQAAKANHEGHPFTPGELVRMSQTMFVPGVTWVVATSMLQHYLIANHWRFDPATFLSIFTGLAITAFTVKEYAIPKLQKIDSEGMYPPLANRFWSGLRWRKVPVPWFSSKRGKWLVKMVGDQFVQCAAFLTSELNPPRE